MDGRVRVHNMAVGGWDANHYLRKARASQVRRPYDLVVVFLYAGNNVVRERRDTIPRRTPTEVHSFRIPEHPSYQELVDAWHYPVNDFLEVRSKAFILFKQSAQEVLRKLNLTAGYFKETSEVTQAEGAPSVFVLIPTQC